jgi:lipopolysaccharide/colanic/teichoic acid biosynthesis glycosyltransferase
MDLELDYDREFRYDHVVRGIVGPCLFASLKLVIDRAVAVFLLVTAAPLIFGLMALVRMTSRGPSIYSQVRLGLNGRPYFIYKLRSMYSDCERATGAVWARPGDIRVTPLGRILRRTHLDELPQLWNVVRGDMSLVGPRPERPVFVDKLEEIIPGYRGRMRVRPGITGLAQVQLPPDEDYEGVSRKVAYDLYYVQSASLTLDIQIIVGTALKITGVPFEAIRRLTGLPTRNEVYGLTSWIGSRDSLTRVEPVTVVG